MEDLYHVNIYHKLVGKKKNKKEQRHFQCFCYRFDIAEKARGGGRGHVMEGDEDEAIKLFYSLTQYLR